MTSPPDDLPIYRVLTGPDDAAFCHRVSEAIALGYVAGEAAARSRTGARVAGQELDDLLADPREIGAQLHEYYKCYQCCKKRWGK